MILSGYQEAAFSSFYTSRPFTSLASVSTLATGEVAAVHLSALSTELLFSSVHPPTYLLLSFSLFSSLFSPFSSLFSLLCPSLSNSASFYTGRGHYNGYFSKHRPGAFPGSTHLAPRVRRAGGWFRWPMDGHGRPAGTPDKGNSSSSELSILPAMDAAVYRYRQHACSCHDDAQMPWHLASSQGRD